MRVLLTGGTGYLGRAIARALARRGHVVVLFARTARAAVKAGLPGVPIDGDVRDGAAVLAAAEGCEAICHCAALVSTWRPRRADFHEVNVGGLGHALDAAARWGVRRLVYTSSFLALPPSGGPSAGRPLDGNDYQQSKLAAERLAATAITTGSPLIRLYPGVIYGPGEVTEGNLVTRLISDHLAGRLPGIIGAERLWSFAHVEDVAEAHVEALERGEPGATYQLGGENLAQGQLYEIVRERTGLRPPRRIPLAAAYAAAVLDEMRAKISGATPKLTRGTVEVLRHDWALDSSKAVRDLGYRVTPLATGLIAVLDSLQQAESRRSSGAPNLQPR